VGVIVALEMTDKFLELLAWSTWVVGAANDRTAKGSIHVFCCWFPWFVWQFLLSNQPRFVAKLLSPCQSQPSSVGVGGVWLGRLQIGMQLLHLELRNN
jgi:hypothetical protein